MKNKIKILEADIEKEIENLELILKEFEKEVVPMLEHNYIRNFDKLAVGGYLHNIYNGIENIFKNIAKFFENNISKEMYHSELLKRMTVNIKGIRPNVIDYELFVLLNDLKGFRHVFRHSYHFELDWEKERITAKRIPVIIDKLKVQINNFFAKLKTLVSKGNNNE
jgi:hypothetical protein